jgi:hypothetical protein
MKPVAKGTKSTTPKDDKGAKHPLADVDPVRRIAAIFATLNPLAPAILANAMAR